MRPAGTAADEAALETALAALAEEYEIEREIGRGGTAVVYAAHDRALARPVAIKLVVPAGEPERLEAFAREARTAAQLVHPNIVAVHVVRPLPGGALALVMQYVPGPSLRELLLAEGALPVERAASILADIAHGLHHAHVRGTVHGDVKPENVLVDETTGRALLSDFGSAVGGDPLDPRPSVFAGTPAYMAPEQIEGGRVDARSDVFSLGVVGWELLTGLSPWGSGSPRQILARRIESSPPPVRELRPEVPGWLAEAIDRALRAPPEERWPSAAEMAEALETPKRGSRFGAWRRGRTRARAAPTGAAAPVTAAPAIERMETVRWERAVPPLPSENPITPAVVVPRRSRGRRLAALAAGVLVVGTASAVALVRQAGLQDDVVPMIREIADRASVEVPIAIPEADPAPAAPPSAAVPLPSRPVPLVQDQVLPTAEDSIAAGLLAAAEARDADSLATPDAPGSAEPEPPPREARPAPAPSVATTPPTRAPIAGAVGESATTAARRAAESPRPEPPTPSPSVTREAAGIVAASEPARGGSFAGSAARVVAGGEHSCVLDRSGGAWCWGSNAYGQLGTGGTRSAEPRRVGGFHRFASLVAGRAHSCGVTTRNEAWCWGANDRGQVGDGSRIARGAPVRVSIPGGVRQLGVGANHACALDGTGRAWCWGANERGQVGGGAAGPDVLGPRRVAGGHHFESLSVGWDHACALDAEGRAWCWGRNDDGRLGDGTTTDHAQPALVAGTVRFRALAAGGAHTCGLTTNGEAWCWGRNGSGQLGDGTLATSPTPVRVAANAAFTSITAGSAHTCALTRAGDARCWGRNAYGQLGDGSTTDRAAPVAVVGEQRFTQVHATGGHTCATTTDGAVYCWGYNVQGQLGDGTRTNRARPVRVGETDA